MAKRRSARTAARRRRAKVRAGAALVNASDLRGLRAAWRNKDLVLFLGAGVSIPYGLPAWKNLILELMFEQAEGTRRLGRMWPHYRRAVASWMADYFEYDPLVLARIVERSLGSHSRSDVPPPLPATNQNLFLARLRAHLYANYREPRERTTLNAVGDLIASSNANRGVASVVTFNFDDLLERELKGRRVRVQSVVDATRVNGNGIPIVHAHGFIPRMGPLSRSDVVFTEPDYHRLTESVFHWSLSFIVERLRKNTALFIGLSMSDPNLRRLLDASRNSDIPPHWQIQKRHEIHDHQVREVMQDVDRRAREYAKLLGRQFSEVKNPQGLEESIHAALRQADSYDRQVFESLGVKTIWVDSFDQVTQVTDAIATP
jgi:hypothetical protein